jgi:mono/diheme cytochrome c family protein
MNKVAALVTLLGLGAMACGVAQETPEVEIVLPEGNPAKGHEVFQEMRCGTCHRLAGEPETSVLISANPGPTLGMSPATRSRKRLADSIISPSLVIDPPSEGPESHMGDFTGALTVRQLIDLVAYIESLKDTD